MKSKVTIAIPVYNRAAIVGRTLESVAAQTARPLEVILVDNNSTDGTLEELQAWAARHNAPDFCVKVVVEPIPGAAAARNKALALTTTPWLMYFDSDDLMAPDHVARAMARAYDDELDIVGWDVEERRGTAVRTLPFHADTDMWSSLFGGSYSTLRYMARTDLFRRAGGWDADVRLWDDIELASRMLALRPAIAKVVGKPTVTVLPLPDSISVNRGGDYLDRMEAPLTKIAATLPPDKRIWVDCFATVHIGNTRREAAGNSALAARCDALVADIAARQKTPGQRSLIRLLYRFRRAGLRGHAHLLKPIIR